MTEYVLGFYFRRDKVLLILKNHPDWQAGKLNGLGGRVEPGEDPRQAMHREFVEESGIDDALYARWCPFAVLQGEGWRVHVFAVRDDEATTPAREVTDTGEQPMWVYHRSLPPETVISNLHWLVPWAYEAVSGNGINYEVHNRG